MMNSGRLMKVVAIAVFLGALSFSATAADRKKIEALYKENCAICHGANGDGRGRAQGLMPPPRDFTSQKSAIEMERFRLIRGIANGVENTAMTGWEQRLERDEIAGLADYILDRFVKGAKRGIPAELSKKLDIGERVFMENCSVCHGDYGKTGVWTRSNMDTPPRDFTTPFAKEVLTRSRMINSVVRGRPGTAMMAFGERLQQNQVEAVVDYIRIALMGHSPEQAMVNDAAGGGDTDAYVSRDEFMAQPFPVKLTGDPEKGRSIFRDNCIQCHGEKGDGQGPRAYFIKPKPRNFISEDSSRALNRPKIYKAVHGGLKGSVMPAWSKVLKEQEMANVAEYVFRAFVLKDFPVACCDSTVKAGAGEQKKN